MVSLFKRKTFLFFVATVFFSCTEKNNQTGTDILKSGIEDKKLINKIGELPFRISYAGHNKMSKEELEILLASNPYSIDDNNKDLKQLLEKKGLIKGKELLLPKFRLVEKHKIELKNQFANCIAGSLNHDGLGNYTLFLKSNSQSDSLTINNLGDLYFKIEEIIPGGYEELIIITKYYLINGDNFDMSIYEFK